MGKEFFLRWVEPKQTLPKERQRFGNYELFALILPILVEQLLTMLVGIADTLMVSYAGETAVSGVSLENQLNNVFIFVFGAVASGGAVVASQYIGRNDRKNGVTAVSQLLMITVLISVFLMGISILFRSQLLALLFGRVEPDVMEASLIYLIISALSFPALAIYNSSAALFRSMGKVISWNGKILKRILNIAVPNGVENGLFQLSKVALSSIVALFGTVQIAANGVAQSFWSMAALLPLGMPL